MTVTDQRDRARQHGIRSERLAELLLRLKFFRILARNYTIRGGEIDIIARRGNLIVFVEVKARATLIESMESIGGWKRQRVSRAARRWIATHPATTTCSFRADGVFIVPRRLPKHVAGVFELDLN